MPRSDHSPNGRMIIFREFNLGDVEDPQLYAAFPLSEWEKSEEGYDKLVTGPNDTWKVDRDGMKKDQDRRANGFKLFGKYYQSLWEDRKSTRLNSSHT